MCDFVSYLVQVVGTFFVYWRIAFLSFVGTRLCFYFQRYWLILKKGLKVGMGRVPNSSCPLYSFTLMVIIFFLTINWTNYGIFVKPSTYKLKLMGRIHIYAFITEEYSIILVLVRIHPPIYLSKIKFKHFTKV